MDTDLLAPESLFVIFSPPYLSLILKIILLCCFITRVCFLIHDASPRQGLERHPFVAQRKKI